MRRALLPWLFVSAISHAAGGVTVGKNADPASFDVVNVKLNELVSVYFKEAQSVGYVICDSVLNDERLVSLRSTGKQLDQGMTTALLNAYGYSVRKDASGIIVVCKEPEHRAEEDGPPLVYRVRHRDAGYLVDLVSPLIKGTFANRRNSGGSLSVGGGTAQPLGGLTSTQGQSQPSPVSSTYKSTNADDYIVFSGTLKETERLTQLLKQVDVPSGEIMVKAYLVEIGKNETEGSALNMVLSMLKGRVELSIAGPVLGNAIRLKTSSVDAVASALNSDNRFRISTAPFARVRSGSTARLQVGQDVPVLGAVVTNSGGSSSQSVDYRNSGVIIEVSPKVREAMIDLDLTQTVSDFVLTETGLRNTPTLNKREVRSTLSVEDGEVIVIGGLNQVKRESGKSGLWFLPWALSKSSTERETELVLILETKRI